MVLNHEAWIERGWELEGLAQLVAGRRRNNGVVEVGTFLLDFWCLGVKDAFFEEMEEDEFRELIENHLSAEERETIDPACAKKLVTGAVAFAKDLGFLPHRDAKKALRVFNGVDAAACPREFVFGRDGRPCFIPGPYDDDARIRRVRAILTARLGEDGFDFEEIAAEEAPTRFPLLESDADIAIDRFYKWIEDGHLGEGAVTVPEIDGFIAGLHVMPDPLPPSEWLPVLWGGEEKVPVWPDMDTAKMAMDGLMHLFNDLSDQIRRSDEYAVILPFFEEEDWAEAIQDYCRGLLRAMNLRPAVLSWLRGHPDAGPSLRLIDALAQPGGVGASEEVARSARSEPDFGNELGRHVLNLFTVAAELPARQGHPGGFQG